jgi:hypothetical protein
MWSATPLFYSKTSRFSTILGVYSGSKYTEYFSLSDLGF